MDSFNSVFILLFCYVNIIISFNLDVSIPIIKQGSANSFFGFALTQTRFTYDGDTSISYLKLLVGAPTTDQADTNVWGRHGQMNTTGALYDCPYTYDIDDCKIIPFGQKSWQNTVNKNKEMYTNMFYGGSIAASENVLMVCGYKFIDSVGESARWARGYCQHMMLDYGGGSFSFNILNPCDGLKFSQRGHTEYGMSQCGYSVDVHKNSILWGAPGSNDWRGAMLKHYVGDEESDENVDKYDGLGTLQTATDISWRKQEVNEPVPVDKFAYLGSKVKFGNMFTNKGTSTYIAGAPRAGGNGKVLLFEKDNKKPTSDLYLTLRKSLSGFQFGSRFGDEIETVDLNGDGKDDLIVGAPYYSESRVGGIVYVYYSDKNGILFNEPNVTIKSRPMNTSECHRLNCEGAKFGYSISAIGDTDNDGYPDIAIGAPFEGAGAVYIYRGSKDGIIVPYSQRISPQDFEQIAPGAVPVKAFGFSIAEALDIDGNGYKDIAVGAYDSSQVVILRSRPVVQIESHWQFSPSMIDPNINCESSNKPGPCISIRVCFKKSSRTQSFNNTVDLEYTLKIDVNSVFPRMYFKGKREGEHMVKLVTLHDNSKENCKEHVVYSVKNNKDFLNSVNFELTYRLDPNMQAPDMHSKRKRRSVSLPSLDQYPVLNDATSKRDQKIEYKKNCGRDNVCMSDLILTATFIDPSIKRLANKDEYSITASGKKVLHITITIENRAEDAHEASFFSTFPKGLSYIEVLNKEVSCSSKEDNVTCSFGNPMPAKSKIQFQISVDSEKLIASNDFLIFEMLVNTTSNITNIDTTMLTLKIRVIVELDIDIIGFAGDDEGTIYYSGEINDRTHFKNEIDVGGLVEHTYEVTNRGPGNIENLDVPIQWPVYVAEYGRTADLLYLMEEPTMLNNDGRCYTSGDVNELKLKRVNSNSRFSSTGPRTTPTPDNAKLTADEDTPSLKVKDTKRTRRSVDEHVASTQTDEFGKSFISLNCDRNVVHCMKITCELKDIEINQTVTIMIKARLRNSTFLKYYKKYDYVKVYSTASISILKNLPISDLEMSNNIAKAMTTVKADARVQTKREIPYWVIIIAVIGGILLLLLMILILWKCGFFKRQQMDEMQTHKVKIEKQKKDTENKDF